MKIVIVDYGLGNIFSIKRAISSLGLASSITDDQRQISEADRIILPGVGAFGDGMKCLREKGLDKTLIECAGSGKMIFGICLGMQLLMTASEELGFHHGLGLIPGKVTRLPEPAAGGPRYKIPHIGWNRVFPKKADGWGGTILSRIAPGDFFYFAHSYRAVPEDGSRALAVTEYAGIEFCSAIEKDNVSGCQFHPELSGEAGLRIYREFLSEEIVANRR